MPWRSVLVQRKKSEVKTIVSLIPREVWSVTDCYCAHRQMQTHSFIKNIVSQKQQILIPWSSVSSAAFTEGIHREHKHPRKLQANWIYKKRQNIPSGCQGIKDTSAVLHPSSSTWYFNSSFLKTVLLLSVEVGMKNNKNTSLSLHLMDEVWLWILIEQRGLCFTRILVDSESTFKCNIQQRHIQWFIWLGEGFDELRQRWMERKKGGKKILWV